LDVRLAIRIEEFLAAFPPRRFEFGRRDIPVRPAFFGDDAQVLAEIFDGGPAEEPVTVVNLVYDETGLEDNHVRNHGVVDGIGVFGDVEIFLNDAPHIGEKRPVSADSAPIFIRLSDIVGADRDKPTISDFKLTMELNKTLSLPTILGAETSAAEDKNHWVRSLKLRQLPVFGCVVGKLIVGKDGPWNNLGSHLSSSTAGFASPG
jgi:hypothetical protein